MAVKDALVKLASLYSYYGGPLYVADLLKPSIGMGPAFLITFLPVGLMALSAFFMDDVSSRWLHPVVRAGRSMVFIVLGMHLYAAWAFAHGVRLPSLGLHYFGIVVGLVWTAYYLYASRRWARRTDASNAPDPTTPKPIEPS